MLELQKALQRNHQLLLKIHWLKNSYLLVDLHYIFMNYHELITIDQLEAFKWLERTHLAKFIHSALVCTSQTKIK